ncbi:hypothetical protein [Alteromonas macleodii]|uniref:Uncharacterized protein n=1 Tax=Alteromonas macleodii TaxID=28108 RepID=A0A6T9XV77_ALTMA|nr:hypothetical protein [Alteromonas macleodii]CAB9492590.1 conserved membrane protein of unknown function [Alteromonas macleodii]
MDILCKWHVIVKYMLNHDREEMFFPIMTCTFWINIVTQSVLYLSYFQFLDVNLSSYLSQTCIVAFYIATVALFYVAVKNKARYNKAEEWFKAFNSNDALIIKLLMGFFMLVSFVVLLFKALLSM